MKNLNSYIIEKFKINKNIKSKLKWQDDWEEMEQYIADRVKEIEELELYEIFKDINKYDDYGNKIETLYYEGDTFSYSFYDGFEQGKPIDDLSELFSGDEIQEIYDYLIKHE